nr:hypothetical protein [uncultured Rhodopila sp.]
MIERVIGMRRDTAEPARDISGTRRGFVKNSRPFADNARRAPDQVRTPTRTCRRSFAAQLNSKNRPPCARAYAASAGISASTAARRLAASAAFRSGRVTTRCVRPLSRFRRPETSSRR